MVLYPSSIMPYSFKIPGTTARSSSSSAVWMSFLYPYVASSAFILFSRMSGRSLRISTSY